VKFGMEEETKEEQEIFGPLLHAKFHPNRCNVSRLQGEKPQNRPLSKLNTGALRALSAMLPVTRMWANAQRDRHSAKYRWRPLFNAAKFG